MHPTKLAHQLRCFQEEMSVQAPGNHCSLNVREDSSCWMCQRVGGKGKDGEDSVTRTGQEKEKCQTCWCCQDQRGACRMVQVGCWGSTEKKASHFL